VATLVFSALLLGHVALNFRIVLGVAVTVVGVALLLMKDG